MNPRLAAIVAALSLTTSAAFAQDSSIPQSIIGKAGPPRGQTVRYDPGDTLTRGYLALPGRMDRFPALILVHEWNGLDERVKQFADELASHGYVVLASDLFDGREGHNPQENMALVNETHAHPERVIANLNAAQTFLRARRDVAGKVGVMGWCFGGGIALSYALGGADHDATAIFYGSLVTDPAELRRIHHPIYGTFAGQDRSIPADQVMRFRTVLDSLGIRNDIHVYEPVQHGFWLHVDRDPATSSGPAADAWQRLVRYLHETLGGG